MESKAQSTKRANRPEDRGQVTSPVRRIGIVGSRRRNSLRDRSIVFGLVERLISDRSGQEVVIVSGGCPKGADAFAEEAADVFGLRTIVHPVPREPPIESKQDFRTRAFARNGLVARDSDEVYALVHASRTGGTENTVTQARSLGRRTFLVDDFGRVYLSQTMGKEAPWPPEEKTPPEWAVFNRSPFVPGRSEI